jgi:hypothetical protein
VRAFNLAMQERHVHRVRCAMGDIAREICGHDADRAREHAHADDRQALQDAQERRRPRDPDAAAHRGDQGRAGGRCEPGCRAHRAHQRRRVIGVAHDLRETHREQALEGDHRESPEELHEDQREQDTRRTQEAKAIADDARDRGDGARDGARPACRAHFPHERDDRDQTNHLEAERHQERQGERRDVVERVEGDQRARQERS